MGSPEEGTKRGVLDRNDVINWLTFEQQPEAGSRKGSYNDQKSALDRWNSHYRDPEVGASLTCSKNSKEANVAGAEWAEESSWGEGGKGSQPDLVGLTGHHKALAYYKDIILLVQQESKVQILLFI